MKKNERKFVEFVHVYIVLPMYIWMFILIIINYKKSQVKDVNTASKKYISNDILKNELTKKHIIKKNTPKDKIQGGKFLFKTI